LDVKKYPPACATQHVATCPDGTVSSWLTVPFQLRANVASAPLDSETTRWFDWSKVMANGTVPGSALTTGEAYRYPKNPTLKTSTSLPLVLVVTISLEPSGEKATWPLSRTDRRRFEAHLQACPNCTTYLEQIRLTIELAGHVETEELTPEARQELGGPLSPLAL
jgi:hypothetical protein